MVYHFADCVLDTQLYTLARAGQHTPLAPKVFEVLCYLIAHRGRVVSKQELCDRVWEGLAITDAAMESCLRAVRLTVGDSGQAQRIIQTQRGHGYRFVADIALLPQDMPPAPLPPEAAPLPLIPLPVLPSVRPCAACQHPNPEDATFCAACGTRLRQPCAHCGQAMFLPATFCTACGQPLRVLSPPGPVTTLAAAPALAQAGMPPPTQSSAGAERKLVTVLCGTVARTAAGGARCDLETLYDVLQELQALAHEVVRPYGGRLQPPLGDRLLLLFGVPDVHEDDARRAVRVALDLRRRWQEQQAGLATGLSAPWTCRIGLHTGVVVVGSRQDAAALSTIVGEVVSVARVLQEQAAPGQILCSASTARLVQRAVRLEAVAPVQVPGQPTPMATYAVLRNQGRRAPGRARWGRVLSPFVGRERACATLHALLAQVERGRGQVVGVVGEPGIGKSRLLYEFRQSLVGQQITYLTGRCLSYGSTTPYLPVLDVLRHNCGILETDRPEDMAAKISRSLQEVEMVPEEWAPVLLSLFGIQEATPQTATLSPEVRKARTLTAVTQMCLNGSRPCPLILEVEDLHWIDASSEECLTALVERMAGAAILILVTYRPGYRPTWVDKSYATQMALPPLSQQDSLRVVQAVLPAAGQAAPLVPRLLAKAEGNPFFLEELARTVAEQGVAASSAPVPDTVQAVLTARMDRLPASAKHLLQATAVIGKEVALPLLQTVTDMPEETLHGDLRRLQAAEFLYETSALTAPVYTFTHVLTQEVAYHSLVRRARQQYHTRIAQVLEAQFPEVAERQPEFLAHHCTEAGLNAQAIGYWQQAGQLALERSAHIEAISHFTQGLELLKRLPDSAERVQQELTLQLAIGSPLLMLKGHTAPEVAYAYTRAYELAQQLGETPQRFSVLAGLWRFYLSQASLHAAQELAEQCFSLAQRFGVSTALQEAHQIVGSTCFFMGDPGAAQTHLEQATALYDPSRSRTLALSRGTDPGVVSLSRLAWALWWRGYPDRALAKSLEAIALAQSLSHLYSLIFALQYHAHLHVYRREAAQARERFEAVMRLMREHGFVQFWRGGMTRLGWILVEQGAIDEGIAQILQGLDAERMHGMPLTRCSDLVILAQAYVKAGECQKGLQVVAEALEIVRHNAIRHYEPELYRLKGELVLQADGHGLAGYSAPLSATWDTSPGAEAEACLQQAITRAGQQGAKSLELRAVLSLSRLWQRQGKRDEARALLAPIYGWFTEGFDTADLQEAKALLEKLGR